MISLKYVRCFQFSNEVSLDAILDVCKRNRIVEDIGLAPNAYGWCRNVEPVILQTPSRTPYCIGRFTGLIRSVPKELINRKVAAEKKRMESERLGITSSTIRQLEAQFADEIGKEIEPEMIDGYVIITGSGEVMITSNKKPYLDHLTAGLQLTLQREDINFVPKAWPMTKRRLGLFARNFSNLSSEIMSLTVKTNGRTIHIDPHSTPPEDYKELLKGGEIERITLHRNQMLFASVTAKGLIHEIKMGTEFEREWREYGDNEESDLLDFIRTGVWIDQMKAISNSIEMDVVILEDNVGGHSMDDDDENVIAPHSNGVSRNLGNAQHSGAMASQTKASPILH